MRWIARRKAAWAVAAWMAAVGLVPADDTGPGWAPSVGSAPAPAPLRLKNDPPERTPPPIVVPPPDVSGLEPIARGESKLGPPPAQPGSAGLVLPAEQRVPAPGVLPPSAPAEAGDVLTVPPVILPAPPDCPPATNPWANVPVVQPFPRLGMFLVPGSGPGYYSFADVLHGNWREKPPAFPYPPFALQPPSGFDADYRYLDRPDNTQADPFDVLKRMHPTPDTMVTVGGQHSARFMNEVDSRLTPRDNSYVLYRNRVWADFWYQDQCRLYGEFISALIAGNELPPLPIDENRADILNLFVEVKVGEVDGHPVYVRVGRQEMLFGSQRLVSTLDWANTRRTFEGVRAFRRSDELDLDAFWTRPVVIKPGDLDSANHDIQFYGAWVTYRPVKGQLIDVYYLGLSDDTVIRDRFVAGLRAPRGTQEVHTFGARYAGNEGPALFDFEGMAQTGNYVRRDHCAYAYTAALGWEIRGHPWRPQLWVGCDYASGTSDPAAGDDRTFNQLFAFGHYYLGFIDAVGRQNIQDTSAQLALYPDNWVTVVFQYHQFRLAEARDFLYNAAGRPTRRSPTGAAGRDVGEEFDFLANFHLSAHHDLLVGYSKLFAGDFIRATGPALSPELFYVMFSCRW